MAVIEEISISIVNGDTVKAIELTKSALEEGTLAKDVLDNGLIPGIRRVGELFNAGQYYLPELLISGEAMKAALEQLRPSLSQSNAMKSRKFLIGTAQGDVHDIGKNIVIMMLEGNGWEVTDLGVDVTPEQFCSVIDNCDFDIVGISALLTLTMAKQVETIKALESAKLRDKIKVMLGGAPVTQGFAEKVGADAYAANAAEAVNKAAMLVGDKK